MRMSKGWGAASRALAVLAMAGSVGVGSQAASIAGVSPQGEVPQVRQLTVRFAEPVVALGDPRLADPVVLACSGAAVPAGSGRWTTERVWVYDFREALPPGVRCSVKARSGWVPLAAAGALTGRTEFSFSTGGPAIVQISPTEGLTIEEDQHFLLRLNGPAVPASVSGQCLVRGAGIGERQPVQIVSGAARDAVLKARRVPAAQADRSLLLRCPRPLPNETALRLVWGAGIASAANPALVTRQPQTLAYEVRAAFTAEFSCERERAEAPCLPCAR